MGVASDGARENVGGKGQGEEGQVLELPELLCIHSLKHNGEWMPCMYV